MKKCPNCQKTYNDEQNFCFDDASPLVKVGEAETPTMYVPNVPPTQMVNPQQMQNWQQPEQNSPPPPSGFNPPPFTPSAQNQPTVKVGNKLAWVGFYLLMATIVLTIIGLGTKSFKALGYCSYYGEFCGNGTLALFTFFLNGTAFLCGVLALILGFVKPQSFGRKILSLCVALFAGLLFFIQLILLGIGYNDARSYSTTNYNYNYNYNTGNNSNNSNSANYSNGNLSPVPASLDKTIIGMWREDGTTDTITFYNDKSMLLKFGGKSVTGTYQITGTNKVAFYKDGTKFKDSNITVTGNKMTMDGSTLTKVN